MVKLQVELSKMPAKGMSARSLTAPAAIRTAYCLPKVRFAVGLMVRVVPEMDTWAVSLAAMFAKGIGPGAPAAWLTAVLSLVLLASAALVFLRRREVSSPARGTPSRSGSR